MFLCFASYLNSLMVLGSRESAPTNNRELAQTSDKLNKARRGWGVSRVHNTVFEIRHCPRRRALAGARACAQRVLCSALALALA